MGYIAHCFLLGRRSKDDMLRPACPWRGSYHFVWFSREWHCPPFPSAFSTLEINGCGVLGRKSWTLTGLGVEALSHLRDQHRSWPTRPIFLQRFGEDTFSDLVARLDVDGDILWKHRQYTFFELTFKANRLNGLLLPSGVVVLLRQHILSNIHVLTKNWGPVASNSVSISVR